MSDNVAENCNILVQAIEELDSLDKRLAQLEEAAKQLEKKISGLSRMKEDAEVELSEIVEKTNGVKNLKTRYLAAIGQAAQTVADAYIPGETQGLVVIGNKIGVTRYYVNGGFEVRVFKVFGNVEATEEINPWGDTGPPYPQ